MNSLPIEQQDKIAAEGAATVRAHTPVMFDKSELNPYAAGTDEQAQRPFGH